MTTIQELRSKMREVDAATGEGDPIDDLITMLRDWLEQNTRELPEGIVHEGALHCPNGHPAWSDSSYYWENIGCKRTVNGMSQEKPGFLEIESTIAGLDYESGADGYIMCGECQVDYKIPAAMEVEWV